MSRLLARIMLALLMLPLAAVVYTVAVALLMETVFRSGNDLAPFLAAGAITAAFVAVYWVLLWLGVVRWTGWRVGATGAAGAAALVAGSGLGVAVRIVDEGFGAFVGSIAAILVWLVLTVFIWRETAAERAEPAGGAAVVSCPACGYNLTGLARCVCPECGQTFRVEELLATCAADAELRAGGAHVPVGRIGTGSADSAVVAERDAS